MHRHTPRTTPGTMRDDKQLMLVSGIVAGLVYLLIAYDKFFNSAYTDSPASAAGSGAGVRGTDSQTPCDLLRTADPPFIWITDESVMVCLHATHEYEAADTKCCREGTGVATVLTSPKTERVGKTRTESGAPTRLQVSGIVYTGGDAETLWWALQRA